IRFKRGSIWKIQFYDQHTGVLKLDFPDGAPFEADGQILGSYSPSAKTWEYAWNNPHVDPKVARDSHSVKKLGDRLGIPYMQLGAFPLPGPEIVSYLCAIGLKATDSFGIYEGEAGPVVVMIMLKNPRKSAAT